jgi:hemerythrin-like domain-containing protein
MHYLRIHCTQHYLNYEERSGMSANGAEGLHMYDELIAVHTIMRRSTALTVTALHSTVADGGAGGGARISALVRLVEWQHGFIHHHHTSEDEQFWPVLRKLFPDAVAKLDGLSEQHELLDTALADLRTAVARLRETGDESAGTALAAATDVRDLLARHLDSEEPVLKGLFPQVPDADVVALRKAIVAGAPKSGPDLVLGLLQDPTPAVGYDLMMRNFPAPVRWLRPVLVRRYHARKAALRA